MPKPIDKKKPRMVEVTDLDEQNAVREGMEGRTDRPVGFPWDGRWWAEADSLRKWREHRDGVR